MDAANRLASLLALSLAFGCSLDSELTIPGRPSSRANTDAPSSSDASMDASSARADASSDTDTGVDANAEMDANEPDTGSAIPEVDAAPDATAMRDAQMRDAALDAMLDDQPDASADASTDAGDTEPALCEMGLASPPTYAWVPYMPGEAIPLTGAGQSALLIEVALRMHGPPIPATVDVVVTATESGREERTVRPDEDMFSCDGDVCDFSPVFLRTFNLTDDPFLLDYLEVSIDAEVSTDDGVFCTASMEGFLLRRF